MIKVMYTGTFPVNVRFIDKSNRKIRTGDIIEITPDDWRHLSLTGNFILHTESPAADTREPDTENDIRKKKKGGK